jgi:hypothetical protein
MGVCGHGFYPSQKLKELQKENARLKKIVILQALDIDTLKTCWEKAREPIAKPATRGCFSFNAGME